MSEFACPACGGGFPESALIDGMACPWCEFMFGEAAELRENGHFHAGEAFPSSE